MNLEDYIEEIFFKFSEVCPIGLWETSENFIPVIRMKQNKPHSEICGSFFPVFFEKKFNGGIFCIDNQYSHRIFDENITQSFQKIKNDLNLKIILTNDKEILWDFDKNKNIFIDLSNGDFISPSEFVTIFDE